MNNIPEVKLGLIAVSRDCFPIALSIRRRQAVKAAYPGALYECPITVENETDMLKAVADVNTAGCNALVVFLGNFGPETPETLIAKNFDGPCMYAAAAEGDGDLINGRGDAYCGMLNCSYNLGMRRIPAYIPEYPVGTAEDIAGMIADFVPVARAVIGLKNLKLITFGPRPQDFFACNARSRASMISAWRSRRTASWICWWPTRPTRAIRASRPSAPIWPPRWARANTSPTCSSAWRSLS